MTSSQIRAIIGARVSSMKNEKTSHLDQRDICVKYALGQGWDIVGQFEDLDVSAITTSPWQRPDLGKWLNDRYHDWDALVVSKTDRLFRSSRDCVLLAEQCKDQKKILVLVEDNIRLDFYHPQEEQDAFSQMMSQIFLLLASMFAELEGRRFLQRAQGRVRMLNKTDRWGWGIPPFGHTIVTHPSGKGKALGHDPEAQKTLRMAYDMIVEKQMSLVNTTRELTKAGRLTPLDLRRKLAEQPVRNYEWSVSALVGILTSPSTQGVKIVKGKPALDDKGNPVMVGSPSFTPAEWTLLQQAIAARRLDPRSKTVSENPLLGVIRCAVCGRNMKQKNQAGRARRYVCGKTPTGCPKVFFDSDNAEELVEQEFLEKLGDERVAVRRYDPGEDTTHELAEVNGIIDGLREDRSLGLFSSPKDEELYRSQMTALIARREALEAVAPRPAGWVYDQTDQTYRDAWSAATPAERRVLLNDAGVELKIRSMSEFELFVPADIKERMKTRAV